MERAGGRNGLHMQTQSSLEATERPNNQGRVVVLADANSFDTVTPVMDAITTFVKEMRKAGSEAAQKITNVKQAQQIEDAFNALDKKSQESVRHFKDLAEQADKRHKAESDKISMERDEYFLTEIEKNQGDDQTTYVVLGANHIFRIWNWFASADLPGIVLCREAFLRQFGIPVDEWNDQPPVKSAKG